MPKDEPTLADLIARLKIVSEELQKCVEMLPKEEESK